MNLSKIKNNALSMGLVTMLVFLARGSSISWAENASGLPPVLTLQQAYTYAHTNNLKIKAAHDVLDEAQADILTSKIRPNPSLNWDFGPIPEQTYRFPGIEQTFEAPGKRSFRIRVAKDQYQITEATYEQTVQEVLTEVHQSYLTWIGATIKAKLLQQNQDVLQTLVDIAQKRFDAGDIAEMDVVQARMLSAQAQNDSIQANNDALTEKTRLSGLLNTADFQAPEVYANAADVPEPLPPLEVLIKEAITQRKDLAANILSLQAQTDQIKLYHRNILPDLTLQGGYVRAFTDPTWNSGYYITGKVDIPLFDHQQGNLAKAKATQKRLVDERAQLEQQIRTDVAVAYQQATAQQTQWENYRKRVLPLAEEVEHLAQRSYEVGQTGITEALVAHQNTLNIRQQAIQVFAGYQAAINSLQTALGAQIDEEHP